MRTLTYFSRYGLLIACSVMQCVPLVCLAQEPLPLESLWTRPGVDWPRFLGSQIDGTTSESGMLEDWSAGNLKIRWRLDTGEGYGIGSVAAGRFFHFGRQGEEAVLQCLNAETGKPLWRFAYASEYSDLYGYDSGPRSSPLIDDGRVYIHGVEGWLHCLVAETGELIWKVNTSDQFGVVQNFFGVGSTPLVVGDQLLVMVGGSPEASQKVAPGALNQVKPNRSGIVSFNKATGNVNYSAVDDLASYSSPKLVTLGGKPTVLSWMRGALVAFNPDNGQLRWEFPWRARKLESVNAATPVVMDDFVLISECYGMGAVLLDCRQDEPHVVWSDQGKRKKSLETHWNTPVVVGDYLYASSGRHASEAELRCVHWKTGEVQWSQPGLTRASVTRVDDRLVVLGELGDLLLLKPNPQRFEVLTQVEADDEIRKALRAPCWSAPVISHGLMWVRGRDELLCVELRPESR